MVDTKFKLCHNEHVTLTRMNDEHGVHLQNRGVQVMAMTKEDVEVHGEHGEHAIMHKVSARWELPSGRV